MRFLAGLTWALTAVLAPALAQTPPAAPGFGSVVEVNVVNVEVYVTDRDGNRVTGLRKEDFAVFDDGKPVEITNFAVIDGDPMPRPPRVVAAGGTLSSPAAPTASAGTAAGTPETWLNLVVLVDNLHIRPENRTRALEQIRTFLARNVRPDDRVMLATYDFGLHVRQPFTADPVALDASLHRIESLSSSGVQADQARRTALRTMLSIHEIYPCSYNMVEPVKGYAEETRAEAQRTIGALKVLVNSLAGVPGRKAVLYVSDGIAVTPGEELFQVVYELCGGGAATSGLKLENPSLGGENAPEYPAQQAFLDAQKYSLAQGFEDLAAHANANRVTFYTLQASGLRNFDSTNASVEPGEKVLQLMAVQQVQRTNLQNSLTAMAVDTGGRAMLDANDFLPDLGKMREDFTHYYSLGYASTHAGDGKQHRIEVKVKRPGVRLLYRQSYRDKPVLERAVDRTLAALLYGFEDNPLEISVEVGEQARSEAGIFSVPIRLKIPLFKLAILNRETRFEGSLRLLVATRDQEGRTSPMRQVAVPFSIPRKQVLTAMGQFFVYTLTLKLPAGEQQVAIAVRDELAATTSYLSRAVTAGTTAAAKP